MPAFSFPCLPFLRSRRSRSHSSNPAPRDNAAISHSTGIRPSSPSRPSSRFDVPGMDVTAMTTSASHPSPPGNPTDHQNFTARLLTVRAPDDSSGQSMPTSCPVAPSNDADYIQPQYPLALPPAPYPLMTSSQQSLNAELPGPSSSQYLLQPQQKSHGLFYKAHNFNVSGTFVDASITNNNFTSNQFMKELLEKTIPGAEFDSSDRDPPPRCHPGTRLAILDRCLYFIRTCDGKRKMRWILGAAGVGKSALLQSVVESPKLVVNCHASVFFSINGRDDGAKAVITISYQFAAKSELYRQFIEKEINRDPSLLRSSVSKQLLKLIIEPFIHNPHLNSAGRVLIVIDGLDECKNPHTQLELLRLISDLCIKYPSSPLVWLIASRPEQHITSFFSQSDVAPAYEKEEIMVESDEARAEVEQFLRDRLMEIKKSSDSVDPRWPEEQDLWKLANAAGGLFAYAQTAIRYIGDVNIGSPASQLSVVLNVIDNHPMTDVPREDHPMASLDALYARILSNVPSKVMINTRKLLLALAFDWDGVSPDNFAELCNWLGMTPDDAYAAINHLRSVLCVPRRDEAHRKNFQLFHKSFLDYIFDCRRSGFSHDIKHEARQLMAQCVFRILNEAPDGIDFDDANYGFFYGILCRGPSTGDKISLTWPVDEDVDNTNNGVRLYMYKLAISQVVAGMKYGDPTFQSEFCIRILSTRFKLYDGINFFPYGSLRNLVFDGSRRQEFMAHGILKQMPLKAVDVSSLFYEVKLQFCRPATTATNLSDPWKPSCKHEREGKWGEGNNQDWMTVFRLRDCYFCKKRLKHQLEDWKTRSPDHAVLTLFTSTGDCCVEFQFVDPYDGNSEWTYWFWAEESIPQFMCKLIL